MYPFSQEEGMTYLPKSQEYLYYAFIINLDNWGDDKGIMTKIMWSKLFNYILK